MYDVFISYRRVGGAESARIMQLKLMEHGYKVFLDYDELKDGVFNQKIINALNQSKIFLFVFSEHSLDRCVNEDDLVRKEIMHAISKNKHIIPVVPNGVHPEIPKNIPNEIIEAISYNQHSEVRLGQQLNADINMLIEDRIEPYCGGKSFFKKYNRTIISTLIIFAVVILGGIFLKTLNNDIRQSISDFKSNNPAAETVLSEAEEDNADQKKTQVTEQHVEYTQVAYEKVGSFKDGYAKIKTNEGYGFINRNNEVVVTPVYDKAEDFCNGFAEVKKNGKWGFVNSQGDLAIECKFDDVFNFHEGMAIIKEGKKCGFIDETGNVVIPAVYDSARRFTNGLAKVKIDGNWQSIDKNGNVVY